MSDAALFRRVELVAALLLACFAFPQPLIFAQEQDESYTSRVGQYKPGSPHALFYAGSIEEARAAFDKQFAGLKGLSRSAIGWSVLSEMIWFEEEVGNFSRALDFSRQNLDTGKTLFDRNRDYRIGRSLCSLGRSFADIGQFELALSFYDKALAIGVGEEGVKIPPLWGLATQERGLLLTWMRNFAKAEEAIHQTTEFAREHGIPIGIAEGEYLLGMIALAGGRAVKAGEHFKDGLTAVQECRCSYSNIAWGKAYLAHLALEHAKDHPEEVAQSITLAQDSLAYSEKTRHISTQARMQYYTAAIYPFQADEQRLKMLSSAHDALFSRLSQLVSGESDGVLKSLSEEQLKGLNATLKEHGLTADLVTRRGLSDGYVNADPGLMSAITEDLKALLGDLERRAGDLHLAGSAAEAFELENQLAEKYLAYRLWARSYHWGKRAQESLDRLLQSASGANRESFLISRTMVLERLTRALIELDLPRFDAGL